MTEPLASLPYLLPKFERGNPMKKGVAAIVSHGKLAPALRLSVRCSFSIVSLQCLDVIPPPAISPSPLGSPRCKLSICCSTPNTLRPHFEDFCLSRCRLCCARWARFLKGMQSPRPVGHRRGRDYRRDHWGSLQGRHRPGPPSHELGPDIIHGLRSGFAARRGLQGLACSHTTIAFAMRLPFPSCFLGSDGLASSQSPMPSALASGSL